MDWKTSNHMDGSEIRDSIGLQYFAEDGNTSDTGADMDGFNGDDFLAALEGNDDLENQQTAAEGAEETVQDGAENQRAEEQQEEPENQPPEGGEVPPETVEQPVQPVQDSPKICFEQVRFCYPEAGADALSDINLTIRRGQTVGIIGGTGCGKSTLVNLIPRFYEVSSGSIRVDGTDVRSYPIPQLRKKIGMVPQRAVLFSGTLRENMQWNKQDAGDEEIWQALRVAQAEEFVRKLPDGLDTRILQGGENLSGGQKQRLTIARALVGSPEILVLDDSASALDFATRPRYTKRP